MSLPRRGVEPTGLGKATDRVKQLMSCKAIEFWQGLYYKYLDDLNRSVCHPRFFDEHLGWAVGAIGYVRGSGNGLLTSIPL